MSEYLKEGRFYIMDFKNKLKIGNCLFWIITMIIIIILAFNSVFGDSNVFMVGFSIAILLLAGVSRVNDIIER